MAFVEASDTVTLAPGEEHTMLATLSINRE
jgi:copper(I)-binding protein